MRHVKKGTAAILAMAAGGFFLWGTYNRMLVDNYVAETDTSIVISRVDLTGGKTVYSTCLDINNEFKDEVHVSNELGTFILKDGGRLGKRDGLVDSLYTSKMGTELRREKDYAGNKAEFDRADRLLLSTKNRFLYNLEDWYVTEEMVKGSINFEKMTKGLR